MTIFMGGTRHWRESVETGASPTQHGRNSGRVKVGAAIAVAAVSMGALGVWSATAGAALAPLPQFPDNLVLFPNRDFLAIEGFTEYGGRMATIEVHRNGEITGSAESLISGTDGAFEVNHPGGVCWGAGTNLMVTPDLVEGDEVTLRVGTEMLASTTVQGATVVGVGSYLDPTDPLGSTMIVKGSIPEGFNLDNFEQRVIEPALKDTEIARRDIRALFGPLTADANNSYMSGVELTTPTTWTATYVFQDASTAAIADAAGGERAMTWQFTDTAANRQGLTIAEFGEPGGPGMGGCPNGPLQSGPPAPTNITANLINSNHDIQVNWTTATAIPGTPAILGYRVTAVGAANVAGVQVEIGRRITDPAATSTVITGFGSNGVAAADTFQVMVVSFSSVGETFPAATAIPVADIEAPTVSASLPSGSYPVAQSVTLTTNDPTAEIYFTTDFSSPLDNSGGESFPSLSAQLFTTPIAVTGPTTINFAAIDLVGNGSNVETVTYEITNELPASAPTVTAVIAGIADVAVTWTEALPMAVGSVLAGYDVRVYDAVTALSPVMHVEVGPTTLSAVVPGLSSEHNYWVAVAANNSLNPAYTESERGAFTTLGVTANAGLDIVNVSRPSTVTLSGSGSSGADVSYLWTQIGNEQDTLAVPGGDIVTITNPTSLTPSITIPAYTVQQTVGPRFFKLAVTREGVPPAVDIVKVVPVIDPIGITTAKWKSNDFRIVGTGGIEGATITVYRSNGTALGTATVTLGAWQLRLRNGTPFVPQVFATSNRGGRTGLVTVTVG